MKILLAHNHYLIPGGEDESFKAESELLVNQGHNVVLLEEDNKRIHELGIIKTAIRTIWSFETFTRVSSILKAGSFDLVDVQNFFPLISPSIFYAANKADVPVIQTLRNYRLMCLNGFFFRNGAPCELCLEKKSPIPGIQFRCYRNSLAASLVVALMQVIHKRIGTWNTKVNAYIALTNFSAEKYLRSGIPLSKIHVRPNFLPVDPGISNLEKEYAIFVGRNSPEKGLDIVTSAWKHLENPHPLLVIGISQNEFGQSIKGIEWRGHQSNHEVIMAVKRAKFLVFPSLWYENFPRVILEAFACGIPVIASRLGSMLEIVKDKSTGLLFEPGNPDDLAEKVNWLWTHDDERYKMGIAARKQFEKNHTASIAYQQLIKIYDSIRSKPYSD